jgi:DNA-binding SARP family transcriptional activator
LTSTAPADASPPAEIRLFGSFAMAVAGRPVDLAGLKPRPRAILRYLALHAGRPVHREVMQEVFWPEADPETGARSLHVALSAVRRELPTGADGGASIALVREGDAYRLSVPDGALIDLATFETAVAHARHARTAGPPAVAAAAYGAVLAAYGGDLLPEDGPAEWVAVRRDRVRAEVVEAARALGELLLDADPAAAAEACLAGLAVDPYHDPSWRLLVEARERAGDAAAATSARASYGRMLAELGVASADIG